MTENMRDNIGEKIVGIVATICLLSIVICAICFAILMIKFVLIR